jgi:hypothetical protein
LWDSISEVPENLPLTEADRVELDRRVEADMGTFHVGAMIENHTDRKKSVRITKLLVDTESEHTWLPENILDKIGVNRYIRPNIEIIRRNRGNEDLFRAIAGPTIQQYYGYAFERLCEDAMEAILEQLGLRLADIVEMDRFSSSVAASVLDSRSIG